MENQTSPSQACTVKTTVFNLIILDASGSMCSCEKATVSGCNECIQTARHIQSKNAETQRGLMSIYSFSTCGSRYMCKNIPVEQAQEIKLKKDYYPNGGTPLLDAVGATLTDLLAIAETHEDPTGVITIITDGYENASRMYTPAKVAALIDRLKEMGFAVNFIGANIDVDRISKAYHIDNALAFSSDEAGTTVMFDKVNASYCACMDVMSEEEADCASVEERRKARIRRNKSFFGL